MHAPFQIFIFIFTSVAFVVSKGAELQDAVQCIIGSDNEYRLERRGCNDAASVGQESKNQGLIELVAFATLTIKISPESVPAYHFASNHIVPYRTVSVRTAPYGQPTQLHNATRIILEHAISFVIKDATR